MCEMLIRVVDKLVDDRDANAKLSKRGYVIVVAPDGWQWAMMELRNPEWRILKWPHETEENASTLLSPEIATAKPLSASLISVPTLVLQSRGFKLDIDREDLQEDFKHYILDSRRVDPSYVMPKHLTIDSLKVKSEIVATLGDLG